MWVKILNLSLQSHGDSSSLQIIHALTLPAEGRTVLCWAKCYCRVSDWSSCAWGSFGMSRDTSGLNKDADSTGAPETRTECSVGVVTTVTAIEVVKCKDCASKYYNSSHLHPKSSRLYFLHSTQKSCCIGSKQTLLSRTAMQLVHTVLHACCSITCT